MPHPGDVCMFCLRGDGRFRSREHVLPESLGNTTTLLEAGVVCDRCNNGPLSVCDSALVACPPIALLRATQFIRNKKNRLPRAEFGDAGIYPLETDGSDVYLRVSDETAVRHPQDGMFQVELVAQWATGRWQLVSRALLKAGLEMLAFDNGKEHVMDERFDGLRTAVLDGRFSGWVAHTAANTPSPELSITYRPFPVAGTSRLGLAIDATIFGVRFWTAWPARRDLLRSLPGVEETFYEDFGRDPKIGEVEELKVTIDVHYDSRGDWREGDPIDAQIDEIDRRRLR